MINVEKTLVSSINSEKTVLVPVMPIGVEHE